jgi:hypothetical protein
MDETEWLARTDVRPMLWFLRDKASDRKLRLFSVACCRRARHLLTAEWFREVVDFAERFADGTASDDERQFYRNQASSCARGAMARHVVSTGIAHELAGDADAWDRIVLVHLLRCIVGPLPFRPVTIDPKWLTWNHGTVPAIARRSYDERAFHDLPILADALEDAGCTDYDILAHCRGDGPHARGCWVVDLLLGKE